MEHLQDGRRDMPARQAPQGGRGDAVKVGRDGAQGREKAGQGSSVLAVGKETLEEGDYWMFSV